MLKVSELMRTMNANPLVRHDASLAEVVVVMTNTPGRPGAANVVDRKGRLAVVNSVNAAISPLGFELVPTAQES